MTDTPAPSPQQRLQTLRIITMSLMASLVIIGVVAVLALGLADYPSPAVAGGLFVLNVIAFAVAEVVGYRPTPIEAGTSPDAALAQGLEQLQQTTFVRFAVTESPAILALVAAFALDGSAWVYIIGAVWALLSMAWHVWPWRRPVTKVERALDSAGARSGLTRVVLGDQ